MNIGIWEDTFDATNMSLEDYDGGVGLEMLKRRGLLLEGEAADLLPLASNRDRNDSKTGLASPFFCLLIKQLSMLPGSLFYVSMCEYVGVCTGENVCPR